MTIRKIKRVGAKPVRHFWPEDQLTESEHESRERRILAVQDAIAALPALEQSVIRLIHFEGATAPEIAASENLAPDAVLNLHNRALKLLRKALSPLATREFNIPATLTKCVICSSPNRAEIDELLRSQPPGASFRSVMRAIRINFGVNVVSAMTIVGHCKYHE